MNPGLKSEIALILGLVALGGLMGLVFGRPAWGLCGAGLVYVGWHIYGSLRLLRWIRGGSAQPPPPLRGIHSDIIDAIGRLRHRHDKRKRKMGRFLARFREATTALPDAAVILDRRSHIDWCNPAAARLLDLHWPTVAGRYIADVLANPVFTEYLTAGDYSHPLEMASPGNSATMLSIHITRYGKKHQRLLVATDVTEVYKLSRVRRDFIADVSHELRTPLTVLTGFLETMVESRDECPQWQRSVILMQQQTARLETIIDDLLALSRLELGTQTERFEPVRLPALLRTIVSDARILSGKLVGSGTLHPIELRLRSPMWLQGNQEELRSAISNLVFNAVRHSPPGTRVQVTWCTDQEGGNLEVRDFGEGIAAHHIPRLTERFYRVDKTRSRQKGGTGLGLAIVKHALARQGAELLISSEVGQGSSFTCRFPASALVIPPQADDDPSASSPRLGS